jgi:hypothetical protein
MSLKHSAIGLTAVALSCAAAVSFSKKFGETAAEEGTRKAHEAQNLVTMQDNDNAVFKKGGFAASTPAKVYSYEDFCTGPHDGSTEITYTLTKAAESKFAYTVTSTHKCNELEGTMTPPQKLAVRNLGQ